MAALLLVATSVLAAACGPPPPSSGDANPRDPSGGVTPAAACPPAAAPRVPVAALGAAGATAAPDLEVVEGLELLHAVADAVAEAEAVGVPVTVVSSDGSGLAVRTVDATEVADTVGEVVAEGAVHVVEPEGVVAVAVGPTPASPVSPDPSDLPVPAATTGDPLRGSQWSFDVLRFDATWRCGRGAGVRVAVVDTGVDGTHPDLTGRVEPGWSQLRSGPPMPGTGAVDPHGHGTHVAGIIAATAGNGVGIAGVAPEVAVLPVRVLGPDGLGWSGDVAAGILWAVDAGAEVVNLSLGSGSPSASIAAAVHHARSNGVVVVAAAGNGGPNGPVTYPAGHDGVIGVASTTADGSVSWFSTRGPHVEVAAPGSWILSTLPGVGYGYMSGTSMATPHVAGVAALVLSAMGPIGADAVTEVLLGAATDRGPLGWDPAFGWGVVSPSGSVFGS